MNSLQWNWSEFFWNHGRGREVQKLSFWEEKILGGREGTVSKGCFCCFRHAQWQGLKNIEKCKLYCFFFFFSFRLYCNQRVFYSMYRFRYMHKKYTQILENMLCITTHKIFRYNWTCCPEIVWVSLHLSKNKQVIVFSQSIQFFNLWTISHENHASSCAKFFLCIKFDISLLSLTH